MGCLSPWIPWLIHLFYASYIPAPKSLATIHRVKHLLEKAKGPKWHYIIVIFKGGNVTLLRLLQELYLWCTLSCIPIFTADEAKLGQKLHVSCCPMCVHIIKNDSAFLNPIVITHYWSNFVCRKCLDAVVTLGQQIKKHFLKCSILIDACEKPDL